MKLKRFLSVVLLLSICLGTLVSCAVSATEPNEQPDAPVMPNKTQPLSEGEVRISTDASVGKLWRDCLSGNTVTESIRFKVRKRVDYNLTDVDISVNSPVAIDTIWNMLENLDDAVSRRIPREDINPIQNPSRMLEYFTVYTGESNGIYSPRGIMIVIFEKHIRINDTFFETKESLVPWADGLRAYFNQLSENSYEGITSNYILGRIWQAYVDKDAIFDHMEIGFRVDSKYELDTNWTGTKVTDKELMKEIIDVCRTLDSMTFEESDICGCCVDEHWTPSDLGFAYVKLYNEKGFHVLTVYIYREGLHIVNEQTYVDVCVTTSLDQSNYMQCKRLKEIVAAQAQINREQDYQDRREQ